MPLQTGEDPFRWQQPLQELPGNPACFSYLRFLLRPAFSRANILHAVA